VADSGSGLEVIHIRTPEAPVIVGSLDLSGMEMNAENVAVSGDYAYVVGESWGFGGWFLVVDISVPTSPVVVGWIIPAGGGDIDVAVSGNYAYVAAGRILVIDISTPESPMIVGEAHTLDWTSGIAVSGDCLYVAAYYNSLILADISSPELPVIMLTDMLGAASDVAVSGNYVYVAAGEHGLQVVNAQCEK
jgi:hypothetical protein